MRRQVDDEVMLVRRRQPDLGHRVVRLEDGPAHLPQRLLQRQRVHVGEPLDEGLPNGRMRRAPVLIKAGLIDAALIDAVPPPARHERRRQHPIVGLGQRRVLVVHEAGELRSGRLQQDEVLQARHDPGVRPDDGHRGRTHGIAATRPGVVVLATVDDHPIPGVLLDLDPGTGHRLDVVHEVPTQRERVVFDLIDAVLLGEREAGVLLRVGRQHPRLIAGDVGGVEIAPQTGRHVDVAQLVPGPVPHHPDHADLGLAVLIGSQDDAHRSAPAIGGVRERCEQQGHVMVLGRIGDREGDDHLGIEGRLAR